MLMKVMASIGVFLLVSSIGGTIALILNTVPFSMWAVAMCVVWAVAGLYILYIIYIDFKEDDDDEEPPLGI